MTMSVLITTVMALLASLLAALAWSSAAKHQWRLNQGWAALCLIAMLLCGWFALVYAGILVRVVDSVAVGQTYLRPSVTALFLLLVAISLKFRRD